MSSYQVKIENNEAVEYHKIVVHRFTMGDVEDPQLYAAHPIMEWQQTEKGKWVMEHSTEQPYFETTHDYVNYGYQVAIFAILKGKDYTYYCLKYKGA